MSAVNYMAINLFSSNLEKRISENVIFPKLDGFENKNKWLHRGLYCGGAILGFLAQVPYMSIASQASSDPIFSKVLGGAYFISWGVLFTWLYGNIVKSEVGDRTSEDHFSGKRACLKTVKIGSAFLLGLASLTPDAWFAYQFNGTIAFSLFTLIGGVGLPAYSLLQSMNKVRGYKRLSPEEKILSNFRELLLEKVAKLKLLDRDCLGFSELIRIFSLSDPTDLLTEDDVEAEDATPSQKVSRLMDVVSSVPVNGGWCSVEKAGKYAFTGMGLPLGLGQLALSFLGTKVLIENWTENPSYIYSGATFSTLIVTYLYGVDIPRAAKSIFDRGYHLVVDGKMNRVSSKIAPVATGILNGIGATFAVFSWGSLVTLAHEYFRKEIIKVDLRTEMSVVLSLGFITLILDVFTDIIDDGVREYYHQNKAKLENNRVEAFFRLEKLEEEIRKTSLKDFAKFVVGCSKNEGALKRLTQTILPIAKAYNPSSRKEEAALLA